MTVTRTRLDAPPDRNGSHAPSAPTGSRAEARHHLDVHKLVGYFGARAGMWRTIAQIVAETRLPISHAYAALDYLVACRFLDKENEHLTRAGITTPAWIRHDPGDGA